MIYGGQDDNWYALFVTTGQEDNVKTRLNYRFSDKFRVLVPKRSLRERKGGIWTNAVRVLFPGYVLVNGKMGAQEYYELKGTPGLLKFLRTGLDFTFINEDEMKVLSRLVCNDEIIGFSDILVEDQLVTVVDGPLTSMEGIIESVNARKGRAKVKLNFLNELRTVELGVNILKPCI